jgi:hypothetical protein
MAVRDEQHLEETRSRLPWRETLGYIPAVLLVGGLLLYGYLSICYDRFYRNLGVDPSDVGLTYAGTLARSSGFVIVCLVFLLTPLQLIAAQTLNAWRDPTAKTARQFMTVGLQSLVEWSDNHIAGKVLAAQGIHHGTAYHLVRRDSVVLIAMVTMLLPARLPWQSAGVAAERVRNGDPVNSVRFPLEFPPGRFQSLLPGPSWKIGVRLPILAIRANRASVQPAGKPEDFPALQQLQGHILMYLGQSEGTVVLFDVNTKP